MTYKFMQCFRMHDRINAKNLKNHKNKNNKQHTKNPLHKNKNRLKKGGIS